MNIPAKHIVAVSYCLLISLLLPARQHTGRLFTFSMIEDVRVTIDEPVLHAGRTTMIILYALPNGNTTQQPWVKKCNRVMTGIMIFSTSKPRPLLSGGN